MSAVSFRAPANLREHRHAHATALAQKLASEIAALLRDAIAARGAASLVVSGGRSPVSFFQALGQQELDWSSVWVTLADERWVDAESADSNERLLREHLLHGPAAMAHFIALKTCELKASAALAERTQALCAMPRPFDVVVLGMGDDGHTASLFPAAAGLESALDRRNEPLLATIEPPRAPHTRITLTVRALLDARRVFILFQGEHKLAVYRRAAAGASPSELPIAAVLSQTEVPIDVYWADQP